MTVFAWVKQWFVRLFLEPTVVMRKVDVIEIGPGRDELHAEWARLHREATARKTQKDWSGAVDLLKQARELVGGCEDLASALRLPLFLQHGGCYEEAMQEFDALLSTAMSRASVDFAHQPEWVQKGFGLLNQRQVLEKMSLAARREKRAEDHERYEQLIAELSPGIERFKTRQEREEKVRQKEREEEERKWKELERGKRR